MGGGGGVQVRSRECDGGSVSVSWSRKGHNGM